MPDQGGTPTTAPELAELPEADHIMAQGTTLGFTLTLRDAGGRPIASALLCPTQALALARSLGGWAIGMGEPTGTPKPQVLNG